MQVKNIFHILFLSAVLLFVSCGDNKTAEVKKNSGSDEISEELKILNDKIASESNNPDLYHQRAKYYYDHKMYDKGLQDMASVMKIDSSKAAYFLTLSDLYFVTNKTKNAKATLEKCIAMDDKNIDAVLKLAELYFYLKKYDQSIENINKALRIDQYNAKAYFMKGMNFKELKDTAKAISSMQTAVEQDKEYYNAYMQLGILYAAKKNNLAVLYYKNAIKIWPGSEEAWYALGKYYQDIGDWNNALGTYKALLQVAQNKFAHYNMAVIYLIGLKNNDLAIQHFTDAINIDPKYLDAYYARGTTYQEMKDVKKAASDFQSCLSINPQYEPAQTALKRLAGVK